MLAPLFALLVACAGPSPDKEAPDDTAADSAAATDTGETAESADTADSTDTADSGDTARAPTSPAPVLNEWMPKNDSIVEDERGLEGDWVELANPTDAAIDLSGWGLGTDPAAGPAYLFPPLTTIEAGGHLLVWLDGDPDAGPLHAGFELRNEGGRLVLFDAWQVVVEDDTFPAVDADVVWGRFPDGTGALTASDEATPAAANPDDPGPEVDPSRHLFLTDAVLPVALTLSDDAIAALTRDPYTYVEGSITIDGVTLGPVGVKLKGGNGSFRELTGKASFKVDMDHFGCPARMRGLEKLTLNGMVEDPSLTHEMLSYELFRDAGVPAPRSGYVSLTVNGEPRGVYVHIESPDKRFLARWYDNPDGNLYEGGPYVDFTDPAYHRYELDEIGSADPDDYSDVAALTAFLTQTPSEALVPDLEALVDLDAAIRMWAVEVLVGHWDGYFWFPHNYRVYHDPDSGRLSLIPWGTDNTFEEVDRAFMAQAVLATWALRIPSVNDRYLAALDEEAAVMEGLPLADEAGTLHALARLTLKTDPYAEYSIDESDRALLLTQDFLAAWPAAVRDGIATGTDPGADGVW